MELVTSPPLTMPGALGLPSKSLVRLDLVGEPIKCTDRGNDHCFMKRRAMKSLFDSGQLQDWLGHCERKHAHFRDNVAMVSRTGLQKLLSLGVFRVIDVSKGSTVVLRQSHRFVTLSYVWGQTRADASVRNNASKSESGQNPAQVPQHTKELDLETLPRTIVDAMSVVAALGERYLWVDKICINQFDAEEKATVISEMSAIYGTANLNIVAAAGSDAESGLSGVRSGSRLEEVLTTFTNGRSIISLLPHRPTLEQILKDSIWASRGWTYQEQMLSRKCVFFTRDEVLFSCGNVTLREAYQCEAAPYGARFAERTSLYQAVAEAETLDYNHYKEAVTDYTARDLTFAGDRLNAFQGMLSRFSIDEESLSDRSMPQHGIPMRLSTEPSSGTPADLSIPQTRLAVHFESATG